jgi:hypothetical protein
MDNNDREKAIQNAMNAIANDLINKLSKQFLLTANITKLMPPGFITINKGQKDGVREQDSFLIFSGADTKSSIGIFKITSVSEHEATGKLLQGDFNSLTTENSVRESAAQTQANIVQIESMEKSYVVINGGTDLGIKKGDIFTGVKPIETKVGNHLTVDEVELGKIYVLDVRKDYAKAKIIKGYKDVNAGMLVYESTKSKHFKYNYLRVKYKTPVGVVVNQSKEQGVVNVTNSNGTYNVDTKYLGSFGAIRNINILSLGLGWKNLVKDLSTTMCFDIYSMKPLNNWIFYIDWNYEYPIVPDVFHFVVGGAVGYGGIKQKLPDNIVDVISSGVSSKLSSSSIYASGSVGLNYRVSDLIFNGGISYDYLNYKKWKYEIEKDKHRTTETAPKEIVPFNNINLSGLYWHVGVSYVFRN